MQHRNVWLDLASDRNFGNMRSSSNKFEQVQLECRRLLNFRGCPMQRSSYVTLRACSTFHNQNSYR